MWRVAAKADGVGVMPQVLGMELGMALVLMGEVTDGNHVIFGQGVHCGDDCCLAELVAGQRHAAWAALTGTRGCLSHGPGRSYGGAF